MNDFDFLKEHGFGVVYGAEATKNKIKELGKQMTLDHTTTLYTPETRLNDGEWIASQPALEAPTDVSVEGATTLPAPTPNLPQEAVKPAGEASVGDGA